MSPRSTCTPNALVSKTTVLASIFASADSIEASTSRSTSSHAMVARPINPAQIRGARGMLGWSMADLAKAARLSVSTVKRAEHGGRPAVSGAACSALQGAFESAGLRFLADEGEGAGLRMSTR